MAVSLKDKILAALKSQKGFDEEKFDAALKIQKEKGGSLGKILIETGALGEKEYMLVLSRQLNIPPINLNRFKLDPAVIRLVPEDIMRQYKVIPVSKLGDTMTVALTDPLDVFILDKLKAITSNHIDVVLTTEEDVKTALDKFYTGYGFDLKKTVDEIGAARDVGVMELIAEEKIDISQLEGEGNLPPIIKIVNLMLIEAHKKRASDIHIEPAEKSLRVRFRIDGVLHDILNLPKNSQNPVITRIKILAKLDITQMHMPQDGRFKIRVAESEIDFRVSVLPTAYGNKIVLRLLDKSALGVGLAKLGFSHESTNAFKRAIERPYGMILVTGPTGSGKSTTLYSILNQLNTYTRNIITLEDPVEYQIEGITQIQARSDIGLTFASGLRSLLRQNPDVIMVGEIRDAETADIAIKAALTGQLLLSTLHTNDAVTAVTRLMDMGIEPFLIASSLVFICAQRLCKRICPHCKEEYAIPKSAFETMGIKYETVKRFSKNVFYKGKGCGKCSNTGFLGRFGILEALTVDNEIKAMITRHATSGEIKEYAVKRGMKTLKDDAIEKAFQGFTTFEEALSASSED